jgi:hypothetical protein
MGDFLIWQVLLSRNAIHSEVKMTTDERTPDAETQIEDDISKNLLMQVKIVGGIVLLVLLAVFFEVI